MVCKRLKGGTKKQLRNEGSCRGGRMGRRGGIIAETTPRCPVRKDKAKLLQIALQQL